MPRWVKVLLWVVVFGACAGAGALVASRTNPFPPGVEDPGARPTDEGPTGAAPSPTPTWAGVFSAGTSHRLHVGGSCTSDWRGKFRVRLRPDGTVARADVGVAILVPESGGCDFTQAQVQTKQVSLDVGGTWSEEDGAVTLRLRFGERSRDPLGSTDLGGFLPTIGSIRPTVGADSVTVLRAQRPDGDQGSYAAAYRISASCRSSCA